MLIAGIACAFAARGEDIGSLTREGDRYMRMRGYRLAREFYRSALQQNPRDDDLWRKYDLASERLYAASHGRPIDDTTASAPATPSATGESTTASATTSPAGTASGAEGTSTDASAPAAPPPESGEPPPAPTAPSGPGVEAHSPIDIIYLEHPIGTSQVTPAAGNEEGSVPVVIRTPTYELNSIHFYVDGSNVLHCQGTMKNIGDREMRNAKVSVIVYDRALNVLGQGLQYVGLSDGARGSPPIIFAGEDRDFDVPIPGMLSTVGAYRLQLTQ